MAIRFIVADSGGDAMLFADFDWNRVLIMGLIGGAVGGLVGLVSYFVKKKPQQKPKPPQDSDGD